MENNILHGIIFFVAVDEYDMVDASVGSPITKVNLAKMIWRDLFKKVASSTDTLPSLTSTSLMIFFNKVDLFAEYMTDDKRFQAFQKRYPNYKGKADIEQCLDFLKDDFMEGLDEANVKTHFTCALDTDAMKSVWTTVKDHIFKTRLHAAGLVGT